MNYLGYNPGHNGSLAFIQDEKISYYLEEERLSRVKRDGNPFLCLDQVLKKYRPEKINAISICGTTLHDDPILPWAHTSVPIEMLRKLSKKYKVDDNDILNHIAYNQHHLMHALNSYYNSNLDKSKKTLVLVSDGMGSHLGWTQVKYKDFDIELDLAEAISMWIVEDGKWYNILKLMTSDANNDNCDESILQEYEASSQLIKLETEESIEKFKSNYTVINNQITVGKLYEAAAHYLGFPYEEGGKVMGLAPYGQEDPNITSFMSEEDLNSPSSWFTKADIVIKHLPAGAEFKIKEDSYLSKGNPNSRDWHHDKSKVTNIAKNLAWRVQQDTQNTIVKIIQKLKEAWDFENVCISGGYGLNCMANYHYRKTFSDLNFWIDPISHDGGTAIGGAIMAALSAGQEVQPFKNLYLGPEYSREEQFEVLNNLPKNFEIQDAKYVDIAELLYNNNIVCLYQGRSEAGPRALGNRSMLYNPCDPNGKAFVNKIKRREWFRPFAGSMLHEHFEEWFDTYGIDETPYMMYAMDVKEDKKEKIPAIVHVDGTCRIQTVKREQNQHYYDLIKEFYKLSGVPIVFNTSFNLGGEPLVETLEDAIRTLENSNIYYLYLPEFEKLVIKKDD